MWSLFVFFLFVVQVYLFHLQVSAEHVETASQLLHKSIVRVEQPDIALDDNNAQVNDEAEEERMMMDVPVDGEQRQPLHRWFTWISSWQKQRRCHCQPMYHTPIANKVHSF